jgi:hypothetical protein
MECEKYAHQLELISNLDEDNDLLGEAIAHIKTCAECTERYRANKEFDQVIGEKMQDVATPPFLARRIANQISISARHIRRDWRLGYALGGVVLCLLTFIFYNQSKIIQQLDRLGSTKPLAAPESLFSSHYALLDIVATTAAKRHQNILSSRFVVFDDNLTNDSFKRKFSFKIALPTISDNIRLIGGSKCHSCCYEVAYLLYRTDSDSISLCVFSAAEFGLTNWDGKPTMFKKDKYNVAVWKKENLAYAMVSQVSESKAKSIIWDFQR